MVFQSFLFHAFFLLYMILFCFALQRNETDRLSLLAIKDGISSDPNGVLSSWNNSLHFCKWSGVICSKRHLQRVVSLNLMGQSLEGTLSSHIANLSFLRELHLSENNFQGHIPGEIDRLFRLRHLNLSNNAFDGEIPNNLTHCLELRYVILYKNKLTGRIASGFGSLSKLIHLNVGFNNFTGYIPLSLGNLSSLTYLYLSGNNLEGSIPRNLGQLGNLQILAMSQNSLSGLVPTSIYNLSLISVLDLGGNHFHGSLPPELGLVFPNLQKLYVPNNLFTGPIPVSLGNASRIKKLEFSLNNFSGSIPMNLGRLYSLRWLGVNGNELGEGKEGDLNFFTSLTNCSDLEWLHISTNRFGGILPNSIANLSTQMRYLILAENQISGTIPEGIENLVSLNLLHFSTNHITGTIPVQLGKLQKLVSIDIQRNRLSGRIPNSLGNLTQLIKLSLSGNNLHGGIPASLGNCTQLQRLYFAVNKLNGTIPKEIFNLPTLRELVLRENSLTGSLSMEVGQLQNLERLSISNNKFSGEIPSSLGSCIKMENLYLYENFFQGSIPPSLSSLKVIVYLDLSRNNLSGQIPKYLEQLAFLQYLNLSFNSLEGEVPTLGIFKNASAISIEGNKELCGGILKLQLPRCPALVSNEHGRAHSLRVIIPVVVAVTLSLLLFSCFIIARHCKKRSRKEPESANFIEDQFLQVTYTELLNATNGFSSANLIGAGSFGSVYKGTLDRIRKTVAIKVLKLQLQRATKSFVAECRALRSIQHRNIVKILTVCSSVDFKGEDFKALIFKFMPNGNLGSWLHPDENDGHESRNLNFIQRLNIAMDVACALEYLHHHSQTPVVHCDLKPSNILLDDDMVAHVGDFGLARIISKDETNYSQAQSSSLLVRGSIGYIAPEYGTGGDISIYGDVYSFGILLLEMFTGKRPTDDVFEDNISLHDFAKMIVAEQKMEIIDERLLLEEEDESNGVNGNNSNIRSRRQLCLVAMMRIGIYCSVESPKERMEMKNAVKEIHEVRSLYLGMDKQHVAGGEHNEALLSSEGPSYLSHY